MNITRPLLERRTKNPIEIGEMRVYATRILNATDEFVHGLDVLKELFQLTNSIFGTDIELLRINEMNFMRRLRPGEWVGLVFRLDHLEEGRLGKIATISFLAKRSSQGRYEKDVFSGSFLIRLL